MKKSVFSFFVFLIMALFIPSGVSAVSLEPTEINNEENVSLDQFTFIEADYKFTVLKNVESNMLSSANVNLYITPFEKDHQYFRYFMKSDISIDYPKYLVKATQSGYLKNRYSPPAKE